MNKGETDILFVSIVSEHSVHSDNRTPSIHNNAHYFYQYSNIQLSWLILASGDKQLIFIFLPYNQLIQVNSKFQLSNCQSKKTFYLNTI